MGYRTVFEDLKCIHVVYLDSKDCYYEKETEVHQVVTRVDCLGLA